MIENFSALYYQDPYCQENQAQITALAPFRDFLAVELSQTCFYPEGGGQPGDRGVFILNEDNKEVSVLDCVIDHARVLHLVAPDEKLKLGQKLKAKIDWERRFELMQQHSSEHIFSGLTNKKYGYNNVGFHINEDRMTFDFDGYLDEIQILELEREANEVIYADLPIQISVHPSQDIEFMAFRSKKAIPEDLRLVRIEDVDSCACCGTQLKRTGEIGSFLIVDSMRYKGGVRITALAGSRALKYIQEIRSQVRLSSQVLSSKLDTLSEAVKQQDKRLRDAESRLAQVSRLFFSELSKNDVPNGQDSYRYFSGFTSVQVKTYVKSMAALHRGVHYALLATEDPKRIQYFICSKDKIDRAVELLNVALNGKGGGRAGMAQGSLAVDYATARSYLDSICHPLNSLLL